MGQVAGLKVNAEDSLASKFLSQGASGTFLKTVRPSPRGKSSVACFKGIQGQISIVLSPKDRGCPTRREHASQCVSLKRQQGCL